MEWDFYNAWFFQQTLTDGMKVKGLLMRARVDGRWEYRLPTREEEFKWRCLIGW